MVKIHKMFCIEREVADFLKGKNASKLVNELLLDVMQKSKYEGMNREQLLAEKTIIDLKKNMEKKIIGIRKNVLS